MKLTEFLLERIAEDEARANSHFRDTDKLDGYKVGFDSMHGFAVSAPGSQYTAYFPPEKFREQFCENVPDVRLLAECAAKRSIIKEHEITLINGTGWGCKADGYSMDRCRTLRALAAVYADHPDYQQECEA